MRHNKKINHLGRTKAHREAMLANMASSLIMYKRIFTTTSKAKALRKYVEPLITKSKEAYNKTQEESTHSRRTVFASLQNKHAVTELFSSVAEKTGDRPGGYTRIIKTGNRLGDNATMCFIELVDFNDNMMKETKKASTKTRRSRSRKSADTTGAVETKNEDKVKKAKVEETQPVADETAAEDTVVIDDTVDAPVTEDSENKEEKAAE